MTRDDVIKMAKEAGWNGIYTKPLTSISMQEEDFLRFSAFVFAAGAKAAQPQSYEEQRAILIQYLQVMIARCDWHGVADVAMDLREMEAEQRGAK